MNFSILSKKIITRTVFVLLLLLNFFTVSAQCTIQAYATPTTIVCGESVKLTAIANDGITQFQHDFNGGVATGWANTSSGFIAQNGVTDCGKPSPNGPYFLWFGGAANSPRSAEAPPVDVITGGTLCFYMRYSANEGGASGNCENPDYIDEGVALQYWNGSAWITIQYWDPNGGADPTLTVWNQYCVNIPAAAQTVNTRFRWLQTNNTQAVTGEWLDHWGIDDVQITKNNATAQYTWQHTGITQPTGATPDVYPTTTTTYTVDYTNSTGATCSDNITVNVILPTVTATATPTSICMGASSQLIASSSLISTSPTACGVNASSACPPNSQVDEKKIGNGTLVYGWNDGSNPTFGNFGDAYVTTHILYRASDLTAAGMVAGQINSLAFDVNIMRNSAGTMTYPEIKIDMGCTSATAMVSYTNPAISFSNVFSPKPYPMSVGKINFPFEKSYNWDGVQNIVIRICWRVATGASSSAMARYAFTSDNSPGYNCLISSSSNFEDGQCALSTTYLQSRRPNTYFGYCKPRNIPLTYTWTPTTGLSNPNIYNPVASPTTTTTYTVTVQQTGAPAACSATSSVPVTVVTSNMTAVDGARCGTGTVVLSTANCTGTVKWYAASTGGAVLFTGSSYTTPSISATTTYYAECNGPAPSNCVFPRIPVVATIYPVPSSTFTASPSTVCAGVNTTITYTGTVIAGQTYAWNFAGGTVVSGSGQGPYVVNWPNPAGGSYNVTLTVTTPAPANCPSVVTTQTVVVSPGPALTINPAAPTICAPGSVLLTGNVVLNPPSYTTSGTNPTDFTPLDNGVPPTWTGSGGTFSTSPIAIAGLNPTGWSVTSICLNINADKDQEAIVYLKNPCGVLIRLIRNNGGTASTGFNTTCFSPGAATAIGAGAAPFNGTYIPEQGAGAWTAFLACGTPNGNWELLVGDSATSTPVAGVLTAVTLTNWTINFSSTNYITTYAWSPGTNLSSTNTASTTASPTATTTYSLTVTDALGCSATKPVTVTVGSITALATTFTNAGCGVSNGSITIGAVTGGTAPYTYNFNGAGYAATTVFTNLPAGTYVIDVKDANGCIFTKSVVITAPAGPTSILTPKVDATCGLSNGSFTLGTVTGGVGPYTYSYNAPPGAGPYTSTTSYINLAAGNYVIEVKDANGCLYSTTVTIINNPGPTDINATVVPSMCGTANGCITVTGVVGGVAPYTYSFNTPATVGPYSAATNFCTLAAGSYTVEVKDANGCLYLKTFTIIDNPGPTSMTPTVVNSTCGLSDGSITIGTVTGGAAPYTYQFAGSGPYTTTTFYPNLPAGPYQISIKDANGCILDVTVPVVDSAGPTDIIATLVPSTCGAANGCINITSVTGGTAPYTYSFQSGGFTNTVNYCGLAAGSYAIEVKDANGCKRSENFVIIDNPGPTVINATLVPATCGAANGCITITGATGGLAPYTYSFNVPTGVGPYVAAAPHCGLIAGTYNVEVKDANGCLFLQTFTIIDNPGPTGITATLVPSSCGAANGCVNITGATGGTAPYTYSFNVATGVGPYVAAASHCSLIAGTYNVEVKDANGCLFLQTFTIIDNPGPTAITATPTNSNCGAADGSIVISGTTGGVAPYSYSFNVPSGGPYSPTTTYTGLVAGCYNIEVKDANGCLFMDSFCVIDNPGPTAVAFTFVNSSCGAADGEVHIGAVTGGAAPYTFAFNPPSPTFGTIKDFTGLLAGSYTITVKDANGCTFDQPVTIIDNAGITNAVVTVVNSNCGASDGEVHIGTITGGTAPYSVAFNGPAFGTLTDFTGLAANTYPIIIKDANGCTYPASALVIDNPGPTAITTTVVNATCGLANGSINIDSVTGGAAPYLYDFDGAGTFTPQINYTGLIAGTYPIIVQDANGCTYTENVIVNDVPGPTAIVLNITDASCGASDGSVTFGAVTGGVPPYMYSFPVPSVFSGVTSYTGLAAGSYPLEVRDANGCIYATNVSISNNGGPTSLPETHTDEKCGNTDGSITLGSVVGGLAPYTYTINTVPTTATNFTGLAAGNYAIEVTDANGCKLVINVVIVNQAGPTAIVTTVVDESCGNANGTIDLGTVTGGTPPYQIATPTGSTAYGTVTTYTGLTAGTYTFDIKDANGCIHTETVIITDLPGPTAVATSIIDDNCSAGNGSVTFGTVTGGTAPYLIDFDGNGFSAVITYSNLPAGIYPFTIQDANGCTYPNSITIIDNPGPTAVAHTEVNEGCSSANGSITLGTVTGGTTPYTYALNLGAYSGVNSWTGLTAAGSPYTVHVKDANGCIHDEIITITNAAGLTAAATTQVDETCSAVNGSFTITSVTGGTAPYTYASPSGGVFGTANTFSGLAAGTYTFEVKDANGCTYSGSVTLTGSVGPTAIALSGTDETCGASDGSVTCGGVTGGFAPYTISFNGGPYAATTVFTGLSGGCYTVDVKDANGCIFTDNICITNLSGPTAIATTDVNESCSGANGSITIGTITGGTAPYTYEFNHTGGFTNVLSHTGLSATSYDIVVMDANGCTFTKTVTLTDTPGPTNIAVATVDAACGVSDGCATFGVVTGGLPPYTYNFNNSGFLTATNYCGLAAGSYTLVVKDANGCTYPTLVSISNAGGPTGVTHTEVNETCTAANGSITLGAVTGGASPYIYNFGGGFFTATSATNLSAGPYTVQVKDANGCIFTLPVINITDSPSPTGIMANVVDSTCNSANGSITVIGVTNGATPYTYSLDANPVFGPGTSFTGLTPGAHTITVKDVNGCTYTEPFNLTTTVAPTVTISYAGTPFCNLDTSVQPVTINGTGAYTGGFYSSAPSTLTLDTATGGITPSSSAPGTYVVTYTIPASSGCPAISTSATVTIDPILMPIISCGASTTTSVKFDWTMVPGATDYIVSYTIGSNPPQPVGSIGSALTYSVTVSPGDSVKIIVMPNGGAGTCFASNDFTCVANGCVASTATINYATPFCDNNGTPQSVVRSGTGNYTGGTYSSSPAGLPIDANTGDITPSTAGTYVVTYTVAASGGCSAVTDTVTVVVTPVPTASINYAGSPFCTSLTTPQAVTLTGTGAYTGGTYSSTTGLIINTATGAITPSGSTPGTHTVTYTIPASGGCAAIPVTATVIITAASTATISYASPFCISDSSSQPVTITGSGTYTGGVYSATGGLSVNTVTGDIVPSSVSIAGTYTITYSIPASSGCAASVATTVVTINGLPVVTASPTAQTFCSGGTTNIALTSNIPGATFSWTVVQSNVTGATNGSGNNIAQTLTATTDGTATYTITPMANGCSGLPISVTITVNAAPNAIATPANQTICSGQSTGIVLSSTPSGSTFSWTVSQSGATGATNGSGNVISQMLTATGTSLGLVTYTITPTGSNCVGAPITVNIIVTPPPTATATPSTETICSKEATNIALTSSIPGTIFNWNVVQTNVLGASSGTGNAINQVLTTVGNNQGFAVYDITPVTNGCIGETIEVTVTINPIPVAIANPAVPTPICSGETATINLTSNMPGTTFSWAVVSTNVFGATSGTGNLISQALTTVMPADGSVDYVITPIVNGCEGDQITVTVTVRPRPEVFGSSQTTICSEFSPNISLSPSIPGTTFTWTQVATGVSGALDGNGSIIDQDLIATGTTTGTVVYTVTPTANGCNGSPSNFTVLVNPLPTPTIEDGIICVDANGQTFQSYKLDTGFNDTNYDFVWYFNNSTSPIQSAFDSSYVATEDGEYSVQVTNTITGCVSALVSATVTESYPATDVTVSTSNYFSDNATITVTPIGGTAVYLYSLDNGPLQESNVFAPVSAGEHSVTVTDANGCTNETRSIFIIGYPHYFTPNGDGINDNWNIVGLDDPNAKIYIYDRYGKLIKQISPTGAGWDGTYNGELLPSTDYWFTIDYLENGGAKLFKAHFSLKR